MSQKIIGVDIGATKIHVGVVQDSRVINEKKFPTAAGSSREEIISDLIAAIEEVGGSDFAGIGIGVPGLVDEEKGIIYDLLNIPSWKEVPLKKYLEDHFRKPVKITNDANVFAIGEKVFGRGGSYRNMVAITLGTGLGAGVILNGELYTGTLSSAGELGSVPYLDLTIEDYCSGKFFTREYNMDGDRVFALAETGDPHALRILKEYGEHLGNAVKIVLFLLSPEAIFLGGSVSRSFRFFEDSLQETVNSFPFKKVREKIVIKASDTPNIAVLGSAALIVSEQTEFEHPLS